jgi:hypothetical protein
MIKITNFKNLFKVINIAKNHQSLWFYNTNLKYFSSFYSSDFGESSNRKSNITFILTFSTKILP